MARVPGFDPSTGAYVDVAVTRGFPMGGIGAGGFSVATDGGFGEFRWNNNWMCPIRDVKGAFHALYVGQGERRRMLVLRRAAADEYDGVERIRSTVFAGLLPAFALAFEDALPVEVALEGFTPHVPHDERASTLPAAVFRFRIESRSDDACEVAILFALENLLGRGGTGHLGVELGPERELTGVKGRIVYDDVAGNVQEAVALGARRGVRFATTRRIDPRAHRSGTLGQYLLLCEATPGLDVTVCEAFDAAAARPHVLDDFARDGRVTTQRDRGAIARPAAAVAARTRLAGRATTEITFVLAWWTPDHVTEPALAEHGTDGPHDGTRIGHVYERHCPSVDAVATHVLDRRSALEQQSAEVTSLLAQSSLPGWLVRALANSIDSTLCNTIVPASGRLYTLEGLDWHWPMGGLTGTNDQRLSAHPYTQVFFTDLDATELDEFRRLADERGAIPHGNGNCDLGVGTTDVPYGWPMYIKGFLPAKEWTDLTMSFVLQAGKLWRTTGRLDLLDRFFPAMARGMEYLDSIAPAGVPEGGTTYDVWDFPGTFVYTATLYLATLRTMIACAEEGDPTRIARYEARYDAAARRLDALWDARGYWRSSEAADTLFTAALAGDWAARLAGLDPIVDPARAASHLRHAHRVLVEAAERTSRVHPAIPWSEATFDGAKRVHHMAAGLPADEEFTYVWQVLSYQAMEQIYVGEVASGVETLRCFYERLWQDGNAWSGGLRGNGESVYMTHPVIWAVLNALTGAALDVPGRALHLSPRTGGEIARLRCPFFFPSVWGVLHYEPGSPRMTVEIVRTFGEPPTIARVVERTAAGAVHVRALEPTRLTIGTTLTLEVAS
jgi:uncharacterized protein (DUF608 family)